MLSNIKSRLWEVNEDIAAARRSMEELLARRQRILNERDGRLQEAAQAADPTDPNGAFARLCREVSPDEEAAMHALHSGKGVETDA